MTSDEKINLDIAKVFKAFYMSFCGENAMNHEDFMEGLYKHYCDEVREIVLECESNLGHDMNFSELNSRINKLWNVAHMDGLSKDQFFGVLTDTIPEYAEELSFIQKNRKMSA